MKDDKRRDLRPLPIPGELVEQDPSAKFAYELATKPPIKNVASIKAASDVFEANPRGASTQASREEKASTARR